MNGTVNPGNGASIAYFQYGLTTNYGSFTATNSLAANNTTISLSNVISGLVADTTYQFRLVASNSSGVVSGTNLTFKTSRNPIVVTTTLDDGPGSLRRTIRDSLTGDTILFDPSLSGSTIVLTNGELVVTNSLTIDAAALTSGISINGNDDWRIFTVTNSAVVVVNSLTLTNGYASLGGGIYVSIGSTLTLNNSTIAGCTAN